MHRCLDASGACVTGSMTLSMQARPRALASRNTVATVTSTATFCRNRCSPIRRDCDGNPRSLELASHAVVDASGLGAVGRYPRLSRHISGDLREQQRSHRGVANRSLAQRSLHPGTSRRTPADRFGAEEPLSDRKRCPRGTSPHGSPQEISGVPGTRLSGFVPRILGVTGLVGVVLTAVECQGVLLRGLSTRSVGRVHCPGQSRG